MSETKKRASRISRRHGMDNCAYIAGPITGTDGYMGRFAEAEAALREMGYATVNPARALSCLPEAMPHREVMRICLALLDACDTVCLLDGWEGSPGAMMEYGYALGTGKTVITMENRRWSCETD